MHHLLRLTQSQLKLTHHLLRLTLSQFKPIHHQRRPTATQPSQPTQPLTLLQLLTLLHTVRPMAPLLPTLCLTDILPTTALGTATLPYLHSSGRWVWATTWLILNTSAWPTTASPSLIRITRKNKMLTD